jgi:hypothetical protein
MLKPDHAQARIARIGRSGHHNRAALRAERPSAHGTNEQVIGRLSQVSGLTSRD